MTSKDYLSQEEIDALLKQSSDESAPATEAGQPDVNDYLDSLEQDALGEIGNITFGSAATALSTLLGKKVDITTPRVSVVAHSELENEFPQPHVAVHVNYVDGFEGINLLVIRTEDAKVIADLMLGGDGTNTEGELNEIHVSAVQEAMNQMMGSSATSMSTIFNRFVNISPPGIDVLNFADPSDAETIPHEDVYIKVSFRLIIGDLIDSNIMQLLPVSFAKEMIQLLMGGGDPATEEPAVESSAGQATPTVAEAPMQQTPPPAAPPQPPYQQPYEQPAMPQAGQPAPYPPAGYGNMQQGRNVNVQPVQYANFSGTPSVYAEDPNLNMLLDIPLKVTVELGRTKRQVKDILELSQGSIIELDKLAGEPVDILVNNKLIAKGEVVVIDENFGVRVTDIISQADRMQKIQ
ncbi:flagellar motor switch phosphatase FliY [Xylanibacillus composti]|uniref:Flagellar motor switch phosphatase FliY n=1 Tax=Xylanibacillus composti TaxID=1572762 RepID=A0A8J4H4A3_9BACL|nr:flagellar motor switch phosphatase FliY [Xylanibacillus composti]GIQ68634.1 flagellar motor switch phosphatase FliY [Xylanibacillus composti]